MSHLPAVFLFLFSSLAWSRSIPLAKLCVNPSLCLQIEPSSSSALWNTVTIQSTYTGWVGVAFGTNKMGGNAPTYIGWNGKSKGQVVVSHRRTLGHSMPVFVESVNATVPVAGSIKDEISFVIDVPVDLFPAGRSSIDCIYAASNQPPSNPDSASSKFSFHSEYNPFVLPLDRTPYDDNDTPSNSVTFCHDSQSTFCLIASPDFLSKSVLFTVYTAYSGWLGFGIGESMTNSTLFVGWKDPISTDIILSQRQGQGHKPPPYQKDSIFTKVPTPTNILIPSAATLSFSFTIPISSNLIHLNETNSFVFALSQKPPTNTRNPASAFPYHSFRSIFTVDFSANQPQPPSPSPTSPKLDLILIHAVSMFFAWSVLPPIAIFIARYMKDRWGHNWYLAHKHIMLGGVGSLLILGVVAVESSFDHWFLGNTVHGLIGMGLVFVGYPMQIVLGYVSNAMWSPTRVHVPWWDRVHWVVGRGLVLLAVVNTYFGLVLYGVGEGWWVVAYGLWIGVGVLGVGFGFVGEYLMGGVVHHVVAVGREGEPLLAPQNQRLEVE
ncbi:hypothetical protein BDR26DRAFT_816864 [Obelidium mucronatum]|nr:hypothetical protein BDR26DRAFT_816864 [Obelidium mucronatum]